MKRLDLYSYPNKLKSIKRGMESNKININFKFKNKNL